MNATRFLAIASLSAFAAFGAHATDDHSTYQYNAPFDSGKTRAEVKAELAQYMQAGVNPWSIDYIPLGSFNSGKTRAEVKAEYIAHRDQVAAMTGEDSGAAYFAQDGGTAESAMRLAGQPLSPQ